MTLVSVSRRDELLIDGCRLLRWRLAVRARMLFWVSREGGGGGQIWREGLVAAHEKAKHKDSVSKAWRHDQGSKISAPAAASWGRAAKPCQGKAPSLCLPTHTTHALPHPGHVTMNCVAEVAPPPQVSHGTGGDLALALALSLSLMAPSR